MAITIYQNSKGRSYTFQLFEKDGKTPRVLTGLTVTWYLKAMDDNTVVLSLAGNIDDAVNGIVHVVMSQTVSATVRSFITQWILQDGGGTLLDPTDPQIANVVSSAAVSGS